MAAWTASAVMRPSASGTGIISKGRKGDGGIFSSLRRSALLVDLTTSSLKLARRIADVLSLREVAFLDAPVSGGPDGARTGKMAIWVGGDKEAFEAGLPVLNAIGDAPYYVGPIGAGAIAKLVHNCTGYVIQAALAEVFTMGVKAGVEPLALWQAVRKGATGRRGPFEGLADHLLPGNFDPPDFALRLARKDVDLAVAVGREFDVPMRLANLTLMEMTEALNRGWGDRDSRVAMLLQEERAGVEVRVDPEVLAKAMEAESGA